MTTTDERVYFPQQVVFLLNKKVFTNDEQRQNEQITQEEFIANLCFSITRNA